MIGFLVWGRVRIKIRIRVRVRVRVGVMFNVRVFCCPEQLSPEQMSDIPKAPLSASKSDNMKVTRNTILISP